MLRINNISKSFGSSTILQDVSFTIDKAEKAALVGGNGSGKSTLLKIILGETEKDSGSIEHEKEYKIGYLAQDMRHYENLSVLEYFKNNDQEDKINDPLLSFIFNGEISKPNTQRENLLNTKIGNLSGGQKTKVALISLIIGDYDLILLDEPTNNIDLQTLILLEEFINTSESAFIIVSHDREFLDRTTNKILEINPFSKKINSIKGKYSDYLDNKEKTEENTKTKYEVQQGKIRSLKQEVKNMKQDSEEGSKWKGTDNDKLLRNFKRDQAGKSGKKAKALESRIERTELIEKPIDKPDLKIPLNISNEGSTLNIILENVTAKYTDEQNNFSLGPISLHIPFRKRIAFIGNNGSGKSTLVKIIASSQGLNKNNDTVQNKIIVEGSIKTNQGVVFGNFTQEHNTLPESSTLIDFLSERKVNKDLDISDIFNLLKKFGFDETQARRSVSTLSPGGKARLTLALFSIMNVNVLLLDEPTNHLDDEAVTALEESVSEFEGTIILASHDRDFIGKAKVDELYEVKDGVLHVVKDIDSYIVKSRDKAVRVLRDII